MALRGGMVQAGRVKPVEIEHFRIHVCEASGNTNIAQ
jgi:hypothetical protein